MNTSKIEGLITVRDSDNKIIAVAQRLESMPYFEVYSTSIIAVDMLTDLFNQQKIDNKIKE